MISRPCTEVLAVLLCAAAISAQENRGTPEQRAACTPRRPSSVRQLHSWPNQGRALPASKYFRPQEACRSVYEPGTRAVASRSE
jgi:hypothetical protein